MADDTNDRKNRAQRRLEEREQARYEQADRDSDSIIATSTSLATATDGLGVERIVTVLPPGYEAPQTDPDPREVERLAKLEGRLGEEKQARLAALSGTPENGGDTAKAAIEAEGNVGTPKADDTEGTKGKDEQAPAEQPKPEQSKKRS